MALRPQTVYQEQFVLAHDTALQAIAPAVGTITTAANAAAADGDTITIADGINAPVVYEYDKTANGVTGGRVNWPVGTTAASLATALAELIVANQPTLSVSDNLAGVLTVTHKWPGAGGNVTITKSGNAVTTVTGFSGGSTGESAATATQKFYTNPTRTGRVESVEFHLPAGFAANADNWWTIALKNGSTTIASWSTRSTAQGAITAGVPVSLVLSATDANAVFAPGDVLSVVLTKTGTPNPLPPGHLTAHGHYVS